MKRTAAIFLLVIGTAALLGGCGSRYVLVTEDYAVHIATSKPELDPSADVLTFKDEDGKEVSIPRGTLKQTKELRD